MQKIPNTADQIIAEIGDDRISIVLTLIALPRLELVSTMHFQTATCELARKQAEDEDDAIDIATDLEWAAQDEMRALDVDFVKSPGGWPEALERHFAQSRNAAAA